MIKINPDRVSKFIIIDGPRGACKSLYMSALIAERLIHYYVLKLMTGEERHVWSNYAVAFWWNSPTGEKVYLHTEPLNRDTLILFEKELAHGWVYIDEIDQWLDRQQWQAVTQKIIIKGMTQIRKRLISIAGTLQDATWLNGRADFQIDIQVSCRESAFTPWGRKQGTDLGEVAFLTFKDKSGIMTGYKYEESWKEYQLVFQGKRFWNIYDTDNEFDPLESITKYKIKAPVKEIVYGADEQPGAISPADLHSNKIERGEAEAKDIKFLQDIILKTALDYKEKFNRNQIRVIDLANMVYENGNGLYSDKEIRSQLSRIEGLEPYVGTGNTMCKIGEVRELVPV